MANLMLFSTIKAQIMDYFLKKSGLSSEKVLNMYHLDNYKWAKPFQITPKALEQWKQDKKSKKSFLSWALSQKLLDRNKYFKWAMDFYNLPLLDNAFFEQNLLPQDQWQDVKSLTEWNENLAPILIWEDVVFIGCTEPPQAPLSWNFKYRLVLVTDTALRMHLKCMEDLTNIQQQTKTGFTALKTNANPQPKTQEMKVPQKANPIVSNQEMDLKTSVTPQPKTQEMKVPQKANPIVSNQEMDLKTSVIPQPKTQEMGMDKPLSLKKDQNVMPKTPTLSLESDDELKTDLPPSSENTFHEIKENQPIAKLATTTCVKISLPCYEELFQKTKNYFSTILVLENIENQLFPVDWHGKISELDKSSPLVNLSDFSLFKILKTGHPYNGFVVDKEVNKKIFNQLGWPQYPKHVTALPIKNNHNELNLVFLGLSMKVLDYKTIRQIEKTVFDFFLSQEKGLKKAS